MGPAVRKHRLVSDAAGLIGFMTFCCCFVFYRTAFGKQAAVERLGEGKPAARKFGAVRDCWHAV